MRKGILWLAIVACSFAPASAQKVFIDYDPNYDASKVETFAFTFTPETSLQEASPFLHSRIVNAIEHYLSSAGFRQVDRDPDIEVTYHVNATEELRFDTTSWGYGYPSGWYSPYPTTTTVSRYARGTLIVDVWDTGSKKLVWRGMAEAVARAYSREVDKKVDRSIQKMIKKWRKIKAKAGR